MQQDTAQLFVRLALLGALLAHTTREIEKDVLGPSFPLATHGSVRFSHPEPLLGLTHSSDLSPWSLGSFPE